VLFTDFRDYADQDIRVVDVESLAVEPVLTGQSAGVHPAISPDGKWLAYQSDETGRFEVMPTAAVAGCRARALAGVGGRRHVADLAPRQGRNLLCWRGDVDGGLRSPAGHAQHR
jgi:Tol biopolymer transport system component